MTDLYKELKLQVNYPDTTAMELAKEQWDNVAKPLNSLGKFETAVIQLAGIYGTHIFHLKNKAVLTYCADNGVVSEGISQSDSSVTAMVAESMAEGRANINIMAQKAGAQVYPVDIGIKEDVCHPKLLNKKIAYGTGNIAEGAAMSAEQCLKALRVGIELVGELKEKDYQMIAIGEMGIGNTTTSSAMASVLLDRPAGELTGRGAGLSDSALARKINVIRKAVEVNRPDKKDAFDVLQKLGGFDIAAMAGTCIGGMVHRIPIIMDGVISVVAGLTAMRMIPECAPYIFASHVSKEPAGALLLEAMEKSAVLHADMCLGEGTGAVLLFPLLDIIMAEYGTAHTFREIELEPYTPQS
ncbi:MAG: nicotinate-nucleotide--dimethylbenzimidazole phosphoribosyltransferase [Lachnospiraceae bacterium]|nr:nicotinate-nucleotide--dimethylbenzimidazole phosphoribosyltransferase [Lachnospiraceae bacterium]